MTKEILSKIAKAKGIDLSLYDHVFGYINPNYTKVIVSFAILEVCGLAHRVFCCQRDVTLSVCALMKKGEPEWEYTTQGWQAIEDLR